MDITIPFIFSLISYVIGLIIGKNWNKYVARDITFDVVEVDVNDKYYIECETKER